MARHASQRSRLQGFTLYKAARTVAALAACAVVGAAAGCTHVHTRPAVSTLGCAAALVAELPAELNDKVLHCLAAGLIARHCSRTEAWLVAAGKEARDLFGNGDADWADWRADRAGLECERKSAGDDGIQQCCEQRLPASGSRLRPEKD